MFSFMESSVLTFIYVFSFSWSINYTSLVCRLYISAEVVKIRPVYHTIFWTWVMFHLRFFSIDIHKKCESNHYLLLLAIFLDLKMTKLLSLNNLYLVYELKFLFWAFPKF